MRGQKDWFFTTDMSKNIEVANTHTRAGRRVSKVEVWMEGTQEHSLFHTSVNISGKRTTHINTHKYTQSSSIHILITTHIFIKYECIHLRLRVCWPLSLIQKASRRAASSVPFSVFTSTAFRELPTTLHTVVLQINKQIDRLMDQFMLENLTCTYTQTRSVITVWDESKWPTTKHLSTPEGLRIEGGHN